MKTAIEDVRAFHEAFDFPMSEYPRHPKDELKWFRRSLVQEEVKELFKAMDENDMVEIADGVADIIYVLIGLAITYGIPLEAVWNRVQKANMAKLGPDGKPMKNQFGKVIKPPGWATPNDDIFTILIEAGWQP